MFSWQNITDWIRISTFKELVALFPKPFKSRFGDLKYLVWLRSSFQALSIGPTYMYIHGSRISHIKRNSRTAYVVSNILVLFCCYCLIITLKSTKRLLGIKLVCWISLCLKVWLNFKFRIKQLPRRKNGNHFNNCLGLSRSEIPCTFIM